VIRPLFATAVLGLSLLASPTAAAQDACGPDQDTAMKAAMDVNWIDSASDKFWDPAPVGGNFNPCADLSAVLVTTEKATPKSPVLVFLFNRGGYIGVATQKAYPYTTLNTARSTADTVVLDYATKGDTDLGLKDRVTAVRYQWQGDHLATLDPLPPV
jgi:hypothetical protein